MSGSYPRVNRSNVQDGQLMRLLSSLHKRLLALEEGKEDEILSVGNRIGLPQYLGDTTMDFRTRGSARPRIQATVSQTYIHANFGSGRS